MVSYYSIVFQSKVRGNRFKIIWFSYQCKPCAAEPWSFRKRHFALQSMATRKYKARELWFVARRVQGHRFQADILLASCAVLARDCDEQTDFKVPVRSACHSPVPSGNGSVPPSIVQIHPWQSMNQDVGSFSMNDVANCVSAFVAFRCCFIIWTADQMVHATYGDQNGASVFEDSAVNKAIERALEGWAWHVFWVLRAGLGSTTRNNQPTFVSVVIL